MPTLWPWNYKVWGHSLMSSKAALVFGVPVGGESVRFTIFGDEKLEWWLYQIVKEFRCVQPFWYNPRLWQTNRRTDGQMEVGIPILGSRIPGSRTIFSIPNPGIGGALIPGFRDYEKRTKCPNFTRYLPEKYLFPEFLGPIPGSKAESERTRPQHQVLD